MRIEYGIADSRGVAWRVTITGPTHAGSLQQGESIHSLPATYILRYHRTDQSNTSEITATVTTPDVPPDEAVEILEREPEWLYEDWAQP